MSNHTNPNIYYRNYSLSRHVGGISPPQFLTTDQYINSQKKVLQSQNIDLPPSVRYFSHNNANIGNQQYTSEIDAYSQLYESQNSGGCSSCNSNQTVNPTNIQSDQNIDTSQQQQQKKKEDVYLRKDSDRYDLYSGYLYNNGLMSDGYQRRRLKAFYIDINSAFRSKNPSTTGEDPMLLTADPLSFTNNSNLMVVYQPNHNYEINDPITLVNAMSKISILRTYRGTNLPTFEIPGGCNFMKIYYNHNIPLTYTGNTIQVTLADIKGDRGSAAVASFLGSMPINVINTTHQVFLTLSDADISCKTQDIINSTGDPDYFKPNPNYFFIILQFSMHNPTDQPPYTLSDYNFRLTNLALAGVPLNQINAIYPINVGHLNGYHIIKNVTKDTYTIELASRAITNQATFKGGGKCIYVARIRNITVGYTNPNQYSIDLGDVLHNVISVRLVSSEIPNTEKAIRNSPVNRANNKIYWNDIDDGDYLYMIAIPPGNYSPSELAKAMSDAFYATPRISAIDDATRMALGITYTDRHFIQPTININTDEVMFRSFKEFILQTPIIEVVPDVSDDPTVPVDPNVTYQLTFNHPRHGMPVAGQTILIQGAVNHKGILGSVINGEKVVSEIIDDNTYRITLPKFNLIDNRAETGGGVNVFVYIPDFFRMRFDQPDTLGGVLGFRDPGSPTSVTPYTTVVSNNDKYEFESNKNAVGQPIMIKNNALQLSGENYIIMVAEPIRTLLAIGRVKNAFAKILLCDSPGRILYNTFVPVTHYFEDPIHELFRLDISFYTPDGNLFDFNGVEHSFTLEIVTISDIPEGTGINASTGKNYNQTI
jgi:hypothetical protein